MGGGGWFVCCCQSVGIPPLSSRSGLAGLPPYASPLPSPPRPSSAATLGVMIDRKTVQRTVDAQRRKGLLDACTVRCPSLPPRDVSLWGSHRGVPPPERGLRRTARDPLGPRCLRRPVTVAPRHSAMRRTGEPRPVHADPDHGRGKEGRTAFRKGGGHNTGGGRRWVAGGRPWGEAPDAPLRDGLIRFFFPQSEVL